VAEWRGGSGGAWGIGLHSGWTPRGPWRTVLRCGRGEGLVAGRARVWGVNGGRAHMGVLRGSRIERQHFHAHGGPKKNISQID
jgi:hypothetical protein